MRTLGSAILCGLVGALCWLAFQSRPTASPSPLSPLLPVVPNDPLIIPVPVVPDDRRPYRPIVPIPVPIRPRPHEPRDTEAGPGKPVVCSKVSPDGKVEIVADLPASEKKKNVGGKDGAGLCVFTSIEYAARWQNERGLFDFQQKMRQEPGGGYPQKVDAMVKKYAPGTQYVQHTAGDDKVLDAILASGRMAGVTYNGHDPHYSGTIAHMVDLVYFDKDWACISDNNFPGDEQFVWMSRAEFIQRWRGGGGGWCVCLLSAPPPPCARNWTPKR